MEEKEVLGRGLSDTSSGAKAANSTHHVPDVDGELDPPGGPLEVDGGEGGEEGGHEADGVVVVEAEQPPHRAHVRQEPEGVPRKEQRRLQDVGRQRGDLPRRCGQATPQQRRTLINCD